MKRSPEALADGTFDLLVLGGGITGAGIALDAATRGLRVAVIDRGDFASGTSSISSKLVHGGLRYLENGEFGLVWEALAERTRLLRLAPHLVWPLPFVLPFRSGDRIRPWTWRLGLFAYDVLAGSGNLQRSRTISASEVRRDFPGVRPHGLNGASLFADAQMDDARLAISVLRTAYLHGAILANYLEATGFELAADQIQAVRAQDHLGGREFLIRARVVVNATGPWADSVRRLAAEKGNLLAPTRGVHLVAAGRGLRAGFLLLHPLDGRVFFVLPWLGKTLIGTTDTDWEGDPGACPVTNEDIDYLLVGHNHHFDPPLSRSDLLGSFAGVRPLVGSSPNLPSARSREFQLSWGATGLLTAAGGKYTTYRSMAEQVVDAVVARLSLSRRCRTRTLPLDGAPDEPWPSFVPRAVRGLLADFGLAEESARHLVLRYGALARKVAEYVCRDPHLALPVVEGEPDLLAELAYQKDHEMACTPADSLLRRTRLGLFHPELLAGQERNPTAS